MTIPTVDRVAYALELVRGIEGSAVPPWEPLPHQQPPEPGFYGWLLQAGRGAGKTATCARYVHDHVHGSACVVRVTLLLGQAIMFGASVVHRGDSFASDNTRAHWYVGKARIGMPSSALVGSLHSEAGIVLPDTLGDRDPTVTHVYQNKALLPL